MNSIRSGIVLAATVLAGAACTQMQPVPYHVDLHVPSTPETVAWGHLPAGKAPAARVKPGQTVSIDTVSHQGINNNMHPNEFFAAGGVAANEILPDAIEIYEKAFHPKDSGAHVLTGPLYIEGAEPGDLLEVRIVDFKFRVPYGVNNSTRGSGVLPDLHAGPYPRIIRLDLERRVALFAPGIEVPLVPFMGIMAVQPPSALANTRPPGIYGGNMDFNRLTVGASLYLPVYQAGALFYTGDSHAVQADGEVNGTAIEASLTAILQFHVHKGAGRTMKWPRAEDAGNYYVMGMDTDLDVALSQRGHELFRIRAVTLAQPDLEAAIGAKDISRDAHRAQPGRLQV